MVVVRAAPTILLIGVILPNLIAPFLHTRKLASPSTSYHDNPSISPLKLMNSNVAILRLTSENMPDLPESFSSSGKRFSFSGIPNKALSERLPYL